MISSQKGNALWFILVAIVLIGLLTVVISRGGSSVDQSGDVEQLRVMAGRILRYAKSFETAIQNMSLQGISENEISFENGDTATDYTNSNCDTSADPNYPGCLVFGGSGAGLTYSAPPTNSNDGSEWIFTAANNVGTTAGPVGTTSATFGNDLIMLLPNIKVSLCTQINRDLGVSNPSGAPPVDTTGIATTAFTGSYPGGGPVVLDGDPTPFELDRQSSGCFYDDANSTYYFYAVILER